MAETRGNDRGRPPGPQVLGGRYELGALLGYGGMAEVFRGRDIRLGRDVAIKVLRSELATDPSFLTRFRREAQSAAGLSHPNIVAVYDTGEQAADGGALPYIVMEYVEGRTLREVLQSEGRLLPRRAMEICAEICGALEYSHQNGIVHRDIKPGNVMLTRTGTVKVMDFGIARALAASQATVTQTSAVMGTAQYLSPEQARGEHVDARSDVYSTGILLYELLTGRPPFTGDSPVAVAYQHVREDALPPSTYDPELAGNADAVVLKAMAKNPANRYASAGAFQADLKRAAAGQRVAATPVLAGDTGPTSLLAPATDVLETTVLARETADPGRGRRGLAYALLGATVIAVIVIAALLVRGLAGSGSTGSVKVPLLKGLQKTEAEAALTAAKLKIGVETPVPQLDTKVPAGVVLSQSVGENFQVNAGTAIDFSYSAGLKMVQIPPVTGQSLADATKNLQTAMLKVGDPLLKEMDDKDAGTVVAVAPAAGTTVPINTTITLTVVANTTTVPQLNGLTLADAEQALQQANLSVGDIRMQDSTTQTAGTVITSSPGQGRNGVTRGTAVMLLVARTPQPTMSPTPQPPPSTAAPASTAPASPTPAPTTAPPPSTVPSITPTP